MMSAATNEEGEQQQGLQQEETRTDATLEGQEEVEVYDGAGFVVEGELDPSCVLLRLKDMDVSRAYTIEEVAELEARGVGWAPDGRFLAVPSVDNKITVIDVHTGERVVHLEGHEARVSAVSWSPAGRWLASVGLDQKLLVWSTDTWKRAKSRTIGAGYGHVKRSCNNRHSLRFAPSMAWSPDSTQVAVSGADHRIFIWKGSSFSVSKVLLVPGDHQSSSLSVATLAWSVDGLRLSSGCMDGSVQVWDVKAGAMVMSFSAKVLSMGPITALSWCPGHGGDMLAVTGLGQDRTVLLCNGATGEVLKALEGTEYRVYTCAWGPGGDWLATGGGDYKLTVWDVESGAIVSSQKGGNKSWINAMSVSPASTHLVTLSQDRQLVVWHIQHKKIARRLEDISQTKQLVGELQGETEGLRNLLAQREYRIRLLEVDLTAAKEKLMAVRTSSLKSIKSLNRMSGVRKSSSKSVKSGAGSSHSDGSSSSGDNRTSGSGSPKHGSNAQIRQACNLCSRMRRGKGRFCRMEASSNRSDRSLVSALNGNSSVGASVADGSLLDGIEGVQMVEETDEQGVQAKEPGQEEQEEWGEEQPVEEGEEDFDPEALGRMLEEQAMENEQLREELQEAKRQQDSLAAESVAKEDSLVSQIEELKVVMANAEAVQADTTQQLQQLREEHQALLEQQQLQQQRAAAQDQQPPATSSIKRVSGGAWPTLTSSGSGSRLHGGSSDDGESPAPAPCVPCNPFFSSWARTTTGSSNKIAAAGAYESTRQRHKVA